MSDKDLLSLEALKWLQDHDYGKRNHEERTILIKAAKILFPSKS